MSKDVSNGDSDTVLTLRQVQWSDIKGRHVTVDLRQAVEAAPLTGNLCGTVTCEESVHDTAGHGETWWCGECDSNIVHLSVQGSHSHE